MASLPSPVVKALSLPRLQPMGVRRGLAAAAAAAGLASARVPVSPSAMRTAARGIIVPRQLKAYGGTFSESIGERADHLASHLVLQSLSPARARRTHSPLLAKPIKTATMESFSDMLLQPELQHALAHMRITTPSPIQQAAIQPILQRKHTLVAAPHGDGKTLAYLLPLYQSMMKDRDVLRIPLRERRPRMILLAPTKELIEQLQAVCSVLDAATGLKSAHFTSRKRAKYHLSRLLKDTMADVLIMDPKVILRLVRARRLFIDDLRYVAVDEADAMLSSLHDHDAVHLLMKIQKRAQYKHLWPVQTQYVFVTPYITRKLEYFIGRRFPTTVPVMFRHRMHRPPAGGTLTHRFIPVREESEKLTVLVHLLQKHGHLPRVIATDEDELAAHRTPYKLAGTLAEYRAQHTPSAEVAGDEGEQDQGGGDVDGDAPSSALPTALSTAAADVSSMTPAARRAAERQRQREDYCSDAHTRFTLESIRPLRWEHLTTVAAPFTCPLPRTVFAPGRRAIIFFPHIDAATALFHRLRGAGFAVSLLHASLPWAVRKDNFADFASGRTNILCTTDLAARGLDLHVDLVINFSMPTNTLTYLSRAGRTARMGRLGRVYSLYTKQQGVIVSAARALLKRDLPLEGVSNQKAHMMNPRYAEWRTHRTNAIARSYVSMITSKTIPAHLERTYLHHNATWRPIFHPRTTAIHGGVAPRQQQKLMDRVMEQAVAYRRGQLSRRKGGRAKFGSRTMKSGVWNDIGGVARTEVAGASQSPRPAGPGFGPPSGPPA